MRFITKIVVIIFCSPLNIIDGQNKSIREFSVSLNGYKNSSVSYSIFFLCSSSFLRYDMAASLSNLFYFLLSSASCSSLIIFSVFSINIIVSRHFLFAVGFLLISFYSSSFSIYFVSERISSLFYSVLFYLSLSIND